MKRITSLLVFCCILTLVGALLSVNVGAQRKSSDNRSGRKTNNQEQDIEDKQSLNITQGQTDTPVRSEEQLEIIRQLLEQATRYGSVRVQVEVRDFSAQEELLRQLAPFQPEIIVKFEVVPHLGLRVNASALIYLRDSNLVKSIGRDLLLHTSTTKPPVRTPEEQAYFQKAIETAQTRGSVRVTVGLNISFTLEGNLTPGQRAAQREAVSRAADELLRQLISYRASLVTRFEIVPSITLDVDETALIFMRDSALVLNVRENGAGFPFLKEKKRRFGR